jgi:hypothetical protein
MQQVPFYWYGDVTADKVVSEPSVEEQKEEMETTS